MLINGAGGGVGAIAVQIAKAYGARVSGVDGTEKLGELYRKVPKHRIVPRHVVVRAARPVPKVSANRPFSDCVVRFNVGISLSTPMSGVDNREKVCMPSEQPSSPAAHQPTKAELEEDVSVDATPEALAWAVTRGGVKRLDPEEQGPKPDTV